MNTKYDGVVRTVACPDGHGERVTEGAGQGVLSTAVRLLVLPILVRFVQRG